MAVATHHDRTDPASIAARVIERRRRFGETLRAGVRLTPQEWELLRTALALTSEQRLNLYFYYPCLFREAFPPVADDAICDLAWCGRSALDFLLLYDHLLDTEEPPDPTVLFSSYSFQREFLCALHGCFAISSPFWLYLDRYEAETTRALLHEHARRRAAFLPFDLDEVRRQAVGKAAFSRLAVVGLACLTDRCECERMHGLIASNDCFNFARQIVDDLLDWRQDYADRRFSYLLLSALQRLGVEKEPGDGRFPDARQVGSAIYSAVGEEYLAAADSALIEAIRLATEHGPCSQWTQNLEEMHAVVRKQRGIITEVRAAASHRRTQASRIQETERNGVTAASHAAASFLLASQAADGCWRDFATSAGESEDWTTGYVGWALSRTGNLPRTAADRAIDWLRGSQFPKGGWGYHRLVVVDADSTAWCLRFLAAERLHRDEINGPLAVLLEHQHANGGFSTYSRTEPIRAWARLDESDDMSGWCQPQLCVTAAAVESLFDLGLETNDPPLHRAITHLLERQEPDGCWRSYWWAGPHYATAHALEVLRRVRGRGSEARSAGQNWFLRHQHSDGGWGYDPEETSYPFHTALAVHALLTVDSRSPAVQLAVERGVAWLVRNQERDGSWRTSAYLLLPKPNEHEPWNIKKWPLAIHGTGIARHDHRRLFTSATVLKTLHDALCMLHFQSPERD